MTRPPATTPRRIDVRTTSPYRSSSARHRNDDPPMLEATETPAPSDHHQPAWLSAQPHVKLLGEGKVATVGISDAEDGKTITSAERCWDRAQMPG